MRVYTGSFRARKILEGRQWSEFWRLRNSSYVYSYAIALAYACGGDGRVTRWGLFLRRGARFHIFFGSVAYGKAAGVLERVALQMSCRKDWTRWQDVRGAWGRGSQVWVSKEKAMAGTTAGSEWFSNDELSINIGSST